jgi:hypothetical protein
MLVAVGVVVSTCGGKEEYPCVFNQSVTMWACVEQARQVYDPGATDMPRRYRGAESVTGPTLLSSC